MAAACMVRSCISGARLQGAFIVVALAAALAACATPPGPDPRAAPQSPVVSGPPDPVTVPVEIAPPAYTPAHMADQDAVFRVGLLLPFSAPQSAARAEAAQILRAAELALFERADGAVLLLPRDTAGDPTRAREAAQSLIDDGADVILGPLFSASVGAAGDAARASGTPLIAFSTDEARAGDGVYLLSFPPGEEVRRITAYARARGAERFAFIGPDTRYGRTVAQVFREDVAAMTEGLEPREVEYLERLPDDAPEDAEPEMLTRVVTPGLRSETFYLESVSSMTEAARQLAALGVRAALPEDAQRLSQQAWEPPVAAPFQAVLLPEGGDELRTLAPVLIFQDIDPLVVKFLGTSLWRDPDVAREPALAGGWFAGPDPDARAGFEAEFEAAYGAAPSRLAGLGYDALSLAAFLSREDAGALAEALERPDGFTGVDGLFRFREDGTIERGLAVYTISRGAFRTLEPAPSAFPPPGEMPGADPLHDEGAAEAFDPALEDPEADPES